MAGLLRREPYKIVDKHPKWFYDFCIDKKKGGQMGITTISPKYQVVIPKESGKNLT